MLDGFKYIELGYLSPDWKVFKSKRALAIIEKYAFDVFQFDNEKNKPEDYFEWFIDRRTGHKHLLIACSDIVPEMKNKESLKAAIDHISGFMWGISYG